MKVWLDDVREMTFSFDHHARTASEAICLLATGAVQRISLDHDLGDAENGTGYEVAKWIEERAFAWGKGEENGLPPLEWEVHSQNPVGVGNMTHALQNADRFWAMRQQPFDEKEQRTLFYLFLFFCFFFFVFFVVDGIGLSPRTINWRVV